jgi:hypothetical protein
MAKHYSISVLFIYKNAFRSVPQKNQMMRRIILSVLLSVCQFCLAVCSSLKNTYSRPDEAMEWGRPACMQLHVCEHAIVSVAVSPGTGASAERTGLAKVVGGGTSVARRASTHAAIWRFQRPCCWPGRPPAPRLSLRAAAASRRHPAGVPGTTFTRNSYRDHQAKQCR